MSTLADTDAPVERAAIQAIESDHDAYIIAGCADEIMNFIAENQADSEATWALRTMVGDTKDAILASDTKPYTSEKNTQASCRVSQAIGLIEKLHTEVDDYASDFQLLGVALLLRMAQAALDVQIERQS